MARPTRIEFDGAWYHVMHRGASNKDVFVTDADRQRFMRLLDDLHHRWQVQTHAYCLMDNHYHLLLHTPGGQLSRAMRHLNGVYTQHFNAMHNRDGSLFRGRYKAVLVQPETYLKHLSRYIHRSPLEANVVKKLRDYPWTSYTYYADGRLKTPDWLEQERVLSEFSSRKAYKNFVEKADAPGPLQEFKPSADAPWLKFPAVLGDEQFAQKAVKQATKKSKATGRKKAGSRPSVKQIVDQISKKYGVKTKQVRQSKRGKGAIGPARPMAMYLCQVSAQMSLENIAKEFNLAGTGSAGSAVRDFRLRLDEDRSLKKEADQLKLKLEG